MAAALSDLAPLLTPALALASRLAHALASGAPSTWPVGCWAALAVGAGMGAVRRWLRAGGF